MGHKVHIQDEAEGEMGAYDRFSEEQEEERNREVGKRIRGSCLRSTEVGARRGRLFQGYWILDCD